jgi:hypothetical protein
MSTLRRNASYSQALSELVAITSRGKYVGPCRGMPELQPLELWRGQRIGTHARQASTSRLRFVVGRREGGLPQVVTVLP